MPRTGGVFRRQGGRPRLRRFAFSGPAQPPKVLLPTNVTLDPHITDMTPDAHITDIALDAHITNIALDAHTSDVTLDY